MKILCVIDSLGSGGAQRQMVNLAIGLKAKGHDVELLIYFPEVRFFKGELDAAGIPVYEVHKSKGFSFKVLDKLITLMRSGKYKAVISFLSAPNIYVELAIMISRPKLKSIVSERSSYTQESRSLFRKIPRYLHIWADTVVANSHSHANWLRSHGHLRYKTHVIYNGYPLLATEDQPDHYKKDKVVAFLVVGRINAGKNGVRLVKALVLFHQRNGYAPSVSWVGRQETDPQSLQTRAEMDRLLGENPQVSARWQWLGEREDIPQLMASCNSLIHVSLYEGLPNVVCEALMAGRPVIASNVCDHPFLIEDGVRGLLCDPLSSDSICATIERFTAMTATEKATLGQNARNYAEQNLTIARMVTEFETFIFESTH